MAGRNSIDGTVAPPRASVSWNVRVSPVHSGCQIEIGHCLRRGFTQIFHVAQTKRREMARRFWIGQEVVTVKTAVFLVVSSQFGRQCQSVTENLCFTCGVGRHMSDCGYQIIPDAHADQFFSVFQNKSTLVFSGVCPRQEP